MNINLSRESFQVGNNFQGIHHYLILKNQLKNFEIVHLSFEANEKNKSIVSVNKYLNNDL